MKFYYPVVIGRKDDGGWHASFPDLAMCEVDGTDEFDVLQNARDAAYSWIDLELQEKDPKLPSPSDPKDVKTALYVHVFTSLLQFHAILRHTGSAALSSSRTLTARSG